MGRKILFFDIDGTLVDNEDRHVPPSAAEAIRRAREAGHLVYINSGRPYKGIDLQLRTMGFDGFACGCGCYIRIGEEVLFHQKLAKAHQDRLVRLVRELDLQVTYEGAEHVYFDLTRPMAPHVEAEKAYYSAMGLDTDGDPLAPDSEFDKFVVWDRPEADMARFRREVSRWYDILDREGAMLEMVPKGCTKGTAMDFLMARHGLGREDCVAIGDGVNDLPMLEAAGLSIAMGNSDPRILDRVDYVTDSLREDGIYKALEHFGII